MKSDKPSRPSFFHQEMKSGDLLGTEQPKQTGKKASCLEAECKDVLVEL
jgi:hypothetical protein